MAVKNYLEKVALTQPKFLQTLVENRRIFNLNNCELNIFESYQQTCMVPLTFNDFVVTSMVRGKKVMHLFDEPGFDYLPGETVIVPANETMFIDFPEARPDNPTQCIALAVDIHYINDTLHYLNMQYNQDGDSKHEWKLLFNQYHFINDTEIVGLMNKLVRTCSSSDTAKNIIADLNLKELLIRLLQTQYLHQVEQEKDVYNNRSRRHYVLNYIHKHLTDKIEIDALCRIVYMSRNIFFKWFKDQFGLTPLEYINRERVKLSKQLLKDKQNKMASIGPQCGFSDANYFVRLFKKMEGITPGDYRQCMNR
jgi:YesN/AraC family two-component response regulator